MKATRAVFKGSEITPKLAIEKVDCPEGELEDGEILGRILVATICGSDLHTVQGKRKEQVPSILGHEGVVEIVKHQRRNSDLKVGDRITFHVANCCYQCDHCRTGLPQKCVNLFKYGHAKLGSRSPLNGCYASHIVLHKGTHITKLSSHIPNGVAAPLNCALATMVNATTCTKAKCRNTGLIQGAGLLGLYGCALLKEAGYKHVYCSDIIPDRLSLVSEFGGIPINPLKSDQSNVIATSSVDVVIEVCGVPTVITEGLRVLKPGGAYVLVGMVHPNSKLDITGEQIIRKCLTIQGIHNYAPEHLDQAVEFLSKTVHKYPYSKLISPSYKLENIEDAFKEAEKQTYLRVSIIP